MDRVVGGKFKLGRKLGSGSFGEIFLGSLYFFVTLFCLLCVSLLTFLFLLLNEFCIFGSGVNVQSGDEVAVKLVSCNDSSFSEKLLLLFKVLIYMFIICDRNLLEVGILSFITSQRFICFSKEDVRFISLTLHS